MHQKKRTRVCFLSARYLPCTFLVTTTIISSSVKSAAHSSCVVPRPFEGRAQRIHVRVDEPFSSRNYESDGMKIYRRVFIIASRAREWRIVLTGMLGRLLYVREKLPCQFINMYSRACQGRTEVQRTKATSAAPAISPLLRSHCFSRFFSFASDG